MVTSLVHGTGLPIKPWLASEALFGKEFDFRCFLDEAATPGVCGCRLPSAKLTELSGPDFGAD